MDATDAAHLLRRTEFVVRPERLAALTAMTREQAVDDVMAVSVPVGVPPYLQQDVEGEGYRQWVFALQWWLDRMTDVPRPFLERMAFFWHGHFCTSWRKVQSAVAMMEQNMLFRDEAFGNFRSMTQTMSIQPAMLRYLDNVDNVDTSPNQNFARELLELFTLGVGNYTEDDVVAAARAWTGHGIDWDTGVYEFHSWDHDNGTKTFMGVARNWDGPDIVDHVLRDDAAKKLVACRFLTRKLWTYLAHEAPPQAALDAVAQVLFDHDMEIAPWVRALLLRDEFYSLTARQGLVRSPVEFVVAVQHHTGLRGAALHPEWMMDGMGQVPFDPPNVAGWKTNAYWTSASQFATRADFARNATWLLRQGGANNVSAGRTPTQVVDHVSSMFGVSLSDTSRAAMLSYVQTQRANEPWIGWWESTNLLTMAMLLPEFHVA